MKIALIYPQEFSLTPFSESAWEKPIGLGYIASMVEQMGYETKLFVPYNTLKEIQQQLINWKPDVIGFQVYTCMVPNTLTIAEAIKKELPNIVIIAGGPHPTALPNFILNSPVDFAVIGEGEMTFRELLNAIEKKEDFSQIAGIAYKEKGQLVTTIRRKRIADLDSLPFPKDFLLDIGKHQTRDPRMLFYPAPPIVVISDMISSRGCHRNCQFCSSQKTWGRQIKYRSAESVIEEMKILKTKGVDFIWFEDLTFCSNPLYVKQLCTAMIDVQIDINWWCQTSINIDGNLLPLMRKAGCRSMAFGVESMDAKSLELMGKNQTPNQIQNTLRAAEDCKILSWAYYMFGFPWETEKSIVEAAQEMIKLPIYFLRLSIATPLPGSQWFESMNFRDLNPNWSLYDTNHLVYDHPSISPKRMKELQSEIFRMFYGSREYKTRVSKMIRRFPELEQSFEEHLAYVRKFL